MASKTFTIPASQKYVYRDGTIGTITTNQTFTMDMTDESSPATAATYRGLVTSSAVTLTDGNTIYLDGDPINSFIYVADNSATADAGGLCFFEMDNSRNFWKVTSADFDDADSPGSVTLKLERMDNPIYQVTWTSVTIA